MEFFKAFFLVLLFAASPFGLLWLSAQEEFTGIMAMTAWITMGITYAVAFIWMTILVALGLGECW